MQKRKQTIAKIKAEINRAGTTNYGRISGVHLDVVTGGVRMIFLWILPVRLPCRRAADWASARTDIGHNHRDEAIGRSTMPDRPVWGRCLRGDAA
jgi:hypothetical protein